VEKDKQREKCRSIMKVGKFLFFYQKIDLNEDTHEAVCFKNGINLYASLYLAI
jgi:hypothetical protein